MLFLTLLFFGGIISDSATLIDAVVVVCDSCKGKGSKLIGRVNDNLVVTYTFNRENLFLAHIYYNGTINDMRISKDTINTNNILDERFTFVNRTVYRRFETIRVALYDLTMQDNGIEFSYEFFNMDLETTSEGSNMVTVQPSHSASNPHAINILSFPILILICVGGVIVVILIITSIVILIRGFFRNNRSKKQQNEYVSDDEHDKDQFIHDHVFPPADEEHTVRTAQRLSLPDHSLFIPNQLHAGGSLRSSNLPHGGSEFTMSSQLPDMCVEYAESGPGGPCKAQNCQNSGKDKVNYEDRFKSNEAHNDKSCSSEGERETTEIW